MCILECFPGYFTDTIAWASSHSRRQLLALNAERQIANKPPAKLYGDSIYRTSALLWCSFAPRRDGVLTAHMVAVNRLRSRARVHVEGAFSNIKNIWKYVKYQDVQQLNNTPVRAIFTVAALMSNINTILNYAASTLTFHITPPSLEDYLNQELQE